MVDFARQPEFLDKELATLAPPGRSHGRVADKLIKLWLQNGTEAWVLVHVEVQGKPQIDFARRMAQMGYRIFDRHGVRPAALAILTDDAADFLPRFFETITWGQCLRYDFTAYKVSENLPENYPDPAKERGSKNCMPPGTARKPFFIYCLSFGISHGLKNQISSLFLRRELIE